jgi:hypothetical protein
MGVPGRSLLVAALSLSLLAFAPPVVSVSSAHWPCGCHPQAYACPCPCPCPHAGMMHGMMMHGGMAPGMMRMEAMKEHLEQIRTTVAALRENEKSLAAARDPAAFQEAATEQFRMLGNILESHLKHMDAMMSRMPMGTMEKPAGPGPENGAMPPDAGNEQHHR